MEALAVHIGTTHAHIARDLTGRAAIARARGTCLLVAPTGSGKTLMVGKVLETLVPEPIVPAAGFKGTVWFWFAPYSGLVEQTRAVLRRDCSGLRTRDLYLDRDPETTRDGDVFVHTWGAVAANNREARRLRRSGERALSVDEMIQELRESGFFIGAVIDEAHLNFGMSAKAAASFFNDHLKPDVTILATATPRDAKLETFQRAAGIEAISRIEVSRDDVVAAGLNKRGLVAAHLALTEEQKLAIDPEEAILRAAWLHHGRIKSRLAERGLSVTPLLLVQVPDSAVGKEDPVDQARAALISSCGVPESIIRVHTSGQPDPAFHALSNDESVEVLIFKLAAATGFDAPRAWSLVSLRPSLSPEFGLQVVGRIMRVHPAMRPHHGQDPMLDRGYVFLADVDRQGGLDAAASQLKSLRSSIEMVVDQLSLIDVIAIDPMAASRTLRASSPSVHWAQGSDNGNLTMPATDNVFVANSIANGVLSALPTGDDPSEPAFPGLFEERGGSVGSGPARKGFTRYKLRTELGMPIQLLRERMPAPSELPKLADEAAQEFAIDDSVLALLMRPGIDVELKLREMLLSPQEHSERFSARPSPAKLAQAAQLVFAFNDDIDPRYFRRGLVDRFRQRIDQEGGTPPPDAELRRAIDQIAVYQPHRIKDAMRRALSRHITVIQAEPIPHFIEDMDGLFEAKRAAFGVFPSKMNGPERRFIELVDESAEVRWWMRNPDHPSCAWSVRVILADGRGFYPDFIIGVTGRRTPDEIRLAEVKDNGETGRLQADVNQLKVRTRHGSYLDVLWVTEDEEASGRFSRVEFSGEKNRIIPVGRLRPGDLRGD